MIKQLNICLWLSLIGIHFSAITHAAKNQRMEELTAMIHEADKEFCQNPQSMACQQLEKFRQGHLPLRPKQDTFFLGPQYIGDSTTPESDGYLALLVKPDGKSMKAMWLHVKPDNAMEDKETLAYIRSVRDGHRQHIADIHHILAKKLETQFLVEVEQQKNFLFFKVPDSPNGTWIRQYKDEWIVLGLFVPTGMRPHAQIWVSAMPIDAKM